MSKVVQGKTRASTGSSRTFRKVTYEILIFEGKKIKIEDRAPLYILLQKSIHIPWGPAGGPVGGPVLFSDEVQLDLLIWNNLAFLHYVTPSYDLLFLLLRAGSWHPPPFPYRLANFFRRGRIRCQTVLLIRLNSVLRRGPTWATMMQGCSNNQIDPQLSRPT